MSDVEEKEATRPEFLRRWPAIARWLSPEGLLGMELVIGFVVALLMGMAFMEIAEEVFQAPATLALDAGAQEVARNLQAPWLTNVMIAVSFFGARWALTPLTLAVLVWLFVAQARRRLVMFAAVMGIGPILNVVLKDYYERARPEGYDELLGSGFSFPSGHSMGSMLFFGALAYVLYFTFERKRARLAVAAACFSAALVIGASRVYLGVHFLSDVIAGFAAGLCWIAVCVVATESWVRWRTWRRARRGRIE